MTAAPLFLAIIHGRESDLCYGYAITGNKVIRSPHWRDRTPGALNLGGVTWANNNTFSIDGRGTMSYSGGIWSCTAGAGAVLEFGQIVIGMA